MSTGLEVQVFLPIINAPFRVYWAYNPLRLDSVTRGPVPITRDMFPPGAAGDFTFEQASLSLAPQISVERAAEDFPVQRSNNILILFHSVTWFFLMFAVIHPQKLSSPALLFVDDFLELTTGLTITAACPYNDSHRHPAREFRGWSPRRNRFGVRCWELRPSLFR